MAKSNTVNTLSLGDLLGMVNGDATVAPAKTTTVKTPAPKPGGKAPTPLRTVATPSQSKEAEKSALFDKAKNIAKAFPLGKTFVFEGYGEAIKVTEHSLESIVSVTPEQREANLKYLSGKQLTAYPVYLTVTRSFAGLTEYGWSVKVTGRMVTLLDGEAGQFIQEVEVVLVNYYWSDKLERGGEASPSKRGMVGFESPVTVEEWRNKLAAERAFLGFALATGMDAKS